jgi:hypothetical protein
MAGRVYLEVLAQLIRHREAEHPERVADLRAAPAAPRATQR